MFQSMFSPASAAPAAAPNLFGMLDPKELERKIGEMETVLAWLKTTTGMLETSLQAMRYQQSVLASLARSTEQPAAVAPTDNPDLAKFADAMNPALWAFNLMQSADTAGKGGSGQAAKGRAAAGKKRAPKRKA